MDVGVVTPRYPPNVEGGGEVSVRMLAENLPRDDRVDNVTVFSFDGSGTEFRGGVEVRRLGKVSSLVTEWQNLRTYPQLRDLANEFDVIHAYNMEIHPAVGALGTFHDIPTVGTLNSYHFFPSSVANRTPGMHERIYELLGHPTTGRILEHYIKKIDVLIALSSTLKTIYSDHGYDPQHIEVIPNMIDPSFSVPDNIPTDGTTLLYVGSISEIKGVGYLVRALTELPPEFRLRIVGGGPMADDLKILGVKLGLMDRITFVGQVEYKEIPEEYALADIFVHPAIWPEPLARTAFEAMQAGLPIVCTDIGGLVDLVSEPELRCEPGKPEALADAIKHAEARGSDIGEANRIKVYSEYSPESIVNRIVDQYEEMGDGSSS